MPIFISSLPVKEMLDFKYFGTTLPNGQAKDEITILITIVSNVAKSP